MLFIWRPSGIFSWHCRDSCNHSERYFRSWCPSLTCSVVGVRVGCLPSKLTIFIMAARRSGCMRVSTHSWSFPIVLLVSGALRCSASAYSCLRGEAVSPSRGASLSTTGDHFLDLHDHVSPDGGQDTPHFSPWRQGPGSASPCGRTDYMHSTSRRGLGAGDHPQT